MKKIKYLLGILAFIGLTAGNAQAQNFLSDAFNDGGTNGLSGVDLFIPKANGIAKLTDLAVTTTAGGIPTLKVQIYAAREAKTMTNAGVGTTLFIRDSTNNYAVGDWLILKKASGYELRSVAALTGTNSITVNAAPTTAQTSTNEFWYVGPTIIERFPFSIIPSSAVGTTTNIMVHSAPVELYFKAGLPHALRATNTAASTDIKFSISGVRIKP